MPAVAMIDASRVGSVRQLDNRLLPEALNMRAVLTAALGVSGDESAEVG